LLETKDAAERQLIQKLLTEEEQKQPSGSEAEVAIPAFRAVA